MSSKLIFVVRGPVFVSRFDPIPFAPEPVSGLSGTGFFARLDASGNIAVIMIKFYPKQPDPVPENTT
jgi:hypothetical protein